MTKSFPRVCGDVPGAWEGVKEALAFSPRVRGCSAKPHRNPSPPRVFPACAGMFRMVFLSEQVIVSFPRVCGDVP